MYKNDITSKMIVGYTLKSLKRGMSPGDDLPVLLALKPAVSKYHLVFPNVPNIWPKKNTITL